MLKSKLIHTFECDGCLSLLHDEGGYFEVGWVQAEAQASHWIESGGLHFCPDCQRVEDDDSLSVRLLGVWVPLLKIKNHEQ